jgi:hypothetical protein
VKTTSLKIASAPATPTAPATIPADLAQLESRAAPYRKFHHRLVLDGFGHTYLAAHTRLALECVAALYERRSLIAVGKLKPLPEPAKTAADKAYVDTAVKLFDGLSAVLKTEAASADPERRRLPQIWSEISTNRPAR